MDDALTKPSDCHTTSPILVTEYTGHCVQELYERKHNKPTGSFNRELMPLPFISERPGIQRHSDECDSGRSADVYNGTLSGLKATFTREWIVLTTFSPGRDQSLPSFPLRAPRAQNAADVSCLQMLRIVSDRVVLMQILWPGFILPQTESSKCFTISRCFSGPWTLSCPNDAASLNMHHEISQSEHCKNGNATDSVIELRQGCVCTDDPRAVMYIHRPPRRWVEICSSRFCLRHKSYS
ncbi:hypothetical protein C8R45DRAFT_562059 [Mycena sanguinolenta]|nr:hypothetical protein C8R45DRAFT_562059 [Mycena sanguinolenta]